MSVIRDCIHSPNFIMQFQQLSPQQPQKPHEEELKDILMSMRLKKLTQWRIFLWGKELTQVTEQKDIFLWSSEDMCGLNLQLLNKNLLEDECRLNLIACSTYKVICKKDNLLDEPYNLSVILKYRRKDEHIYTCIILTSRVLLQIVATLLRKHLVYR